MYHRAMVATGAPYTLTECQRFFEQPESARQRQYEALRAYFLEELPSEEVARNFGYSPGAFRVLCHDFRYGRLPEFFATGRPGPRSQPKKRRAHEQIIALRKRNYSVYEISQALKEQAMPLSATAVREVLAAEGFAPTITSKSNRTFSRRSSTAVSCENLRNRRLPQQENAFLA